ncbi:MAG: hypothetical protein GY696_20020, partial [Gammaproteobacteria bacterium]|nr:hypothetical protein [Gammaproteobacteria bacterium]
WNEEPTDIYHLLCWYDDEAIYAHLKRYDADGSKAADLHGARSLTKTEKRYPSPELDLLNVVWAVSEFSDRLLPSFTVVLTRHWVLATYCSYTQQKPRVARWLRSLRPYRLMFKARPREESEVTRVLDDYLTKLSYHDNEAVAVDMDILGESSTFNLDDGDGDSFGAAWKARYLVTDTDHIRFVPYSVHLPAKSTYERGLRERKALYVKLAVPSGEEPVLYGPETSGSAQSRKSQPTNPRSRVSDMEAFVKMLEGHTQLGPILPVPLESATGSNGAVTCMHKKSPIRENMKSDQCGACKRKTLEQARFSAGSSSP